MTPKSLEELIAELPASERAAIAWAPRAISLELERLLAAPELTPELVLEVSTAFFRQLVALPGFYRGLLAAGHDDLWASLQSKLRRQLELLATQLPVESRRPAMRSLLTWLALVGASWRAAGAQLDIEQLSTFFQRGPPELVQQELSGAKGLVVTIAILHAIETGRGHGARAHELAVLADRDAREAAEALVAAQPDDPRVRLPWYFEGADRTPELRAIASWAEAQTSKNDRALALLERWMAEPGDPDQGARWEQVKRELDRDRSSSRPLFP